jgi:hypothetical protein
MPFYHLPCPGCGKTLSFRALPNAQRCWTCGKLRRFDAEGRPIEDKPSA